MTEYEYTEAKNALSSLRQKVVDQARGSESYREALRAYLEAVVTVRGHAWSMDVQSERRKMAKLVTETVVELAQ